jgi:hypothetical protein
MKKKDKGARGFGYGEIDAETEKFLTPDFDRQRQQAERAVGMYATADKPQVVVEGDDA